MQPRDVRRESRQTLGRLGEALALEHLRRLGYAIVARNYRCREGEVDIVATTADTVVFVEVKARRSTTYGSPLEAVDARKQARLARAARHFLHSPRGRALLDSFPRGWRARRRRRRWVVRFDVVGVTWGSGGARIEHVEDAFEVA